jgi:site-specific recombinase XerD
MPKRQDPEPSTFELCGVIAEWLDSYRYDGSPKTLAYYHDHVERAFLTFMAPKVKNLDDVTPQLIRDYLAHESRTGIAASTLSSRYQAPKTFFTWCEDQGYIAVSPFRRVRRPKVPRPHVVGFEPAEVKRLLSYAQQAPGWLAQRDYAVVLVLLDTGARASELLGLTEAAFDWPRHRVLLHGKGSKDRWVACGQKASRAVREYLKVRPPSGSRQLWLTQRKSELDYGALSMMLKNLGGYAGVGECRPHRFRHTYAAEFYRRHRDIMALRNSLGHAKVETTQRYLVSLGVEYGVAEYASPGEWLAS